MIYPAGTSLPIFFALLPRVPRQILTFALLPFLPFLLKSCTAPLSSEELRSFSSSLVSPLARRVFGRVALFDLRPSATTRHSKRRRKGGNEKKRGRRVKESRSFFLLLSFISSHFRRSPRYPSEFTTYRIYRSDDTYLHRATTDYRDEADSLAREKKKR